MTMATKPLDTGGPLRTPGRRRRSGSMATRVGTCATLAVMGACEAAEERALNASGAAEVTAVAPVERDVVIRGFVVLDSEVRSIKPCGEEGELWVNPVSDLTMVYEELRRELSGPVFVEVEGRLGAAPSTGPGSDRDGLLTVRSLRRAAPAAERLRCEEDVSGFSFRASGREPFWHIQMTPSAIVYATQDLPETRFAGAEPFLAEGGWVYESRGTGPESLQIRATLTPGRCRDAGVEAIYSWSATIELPGEIRRGCAWMGDLAPGR
jgi:uncharacterized membrane protein